MVNHHPETMIAARGIEIASDAFGDPADPASLLIMGAGASMLLWEDAFCERLAGGGRFVIRFDNRDVGQTTCCPPGEPNYTLQDMADDAVAVLDHYGAPQAHIIGASMGGMIAQLVALRHPERALSLALIMSSPDPGAVTDAMAGEGGAYSLSPPTAEVLAAVASAASLDWSDRDAVIENRVEMFRVLAGNAYPYDEASRRALFAREIDRARNMASSGNHGLIIANSPRWHDRLGGIRAPTLVIHGTADPILPFDHGQALARSIPGAEMLEMPGVGHEIPAAEFDRVIPALLALGA